MVKRLPKERETLSSLYYEHNLSLYDIADLYGVKVQSVVQKFKILGIQTRSKSEATRLATPRGQQHHSWNNGRTIDNNGYVILYPDKRLEHVVVMEQLLGRPLTKQEVVHHMNGVRDDNRPDNLYLFQTRGEHARYHAYCQWRQIDYTKHNKEEIEECLRMFSEQV
jgi:hypothetical protein